MADVTKQDLGPVSALAGSKKYGIAAVFVGAAIGLSTLASTKGDLALAVSAWWPAAVVVSAYVVAQGFVEGMAARKESLAKHESL